MGMFDEGQGKEVKEMFKHFSEGAVQPVNMKHVDLVGYTAEFVVKGEDLIIHFFKSDDEGWPNDFRSRIWSALLDTFKLQNHSDRIVIDWIPELYSWCVTIKKLAIVSPPEDEVVLQALQQIG